MRLTQSSRSEGVEMTFRMFLAAVLVAGCAVAFPAASPVGAAEPEVVQLPRFGTAQSSVNWAGYVATGPENTFTSISVSWVEPAVACDSSGRAFASFWVGLDGFANDTVEQIGTDSDCYKGQSYYYAWWEMFPKFPRLIKNRVTPGDQLNASVTAVGGDTYQLTMSDTQRGWTHTFTTTLRHTERTSAEVILESSCCNERHEEFKLAPFGTVQFTNALVNGVPLSATDPIKINMRPEQLGTFSGSNTANTSDLVNGGTDFTITRAGNHRPE